MDRPRLSDEDEKLIETIFNFVRARGESTSSEISDELGERATVVAGMMVSWHMLEIIGGGGDEPYRLTVFD